MWTLPTWTDSCWCRRKYARQFFLRDWSREYRPIHGGHGVSRSPSLSQCRIIPRKRMWKYSNNQPAMVCPLNAGGGTLVVGDSGETAAGEAAVGSGAGGSQGGSSGRGLWHRQWGMQWGMKCGEPWLLKGQSHPTSFCHRTSLFDRQRRLLGLSSTQVRSAVTRVSHRQLGATPPATPSLLTYDGIPFRYRRVVLGDPT